METTNEEWVDCAEVGLVPLLRSLLEEARFSWGIMANEDEKKAELEELEKVKSVCEASQDRYFEVKTVGKMLLRLRFVRIMGDKDCITNEVGKVEVSQYDSCYGPGCSKRAIDRVKKAKRDAVVAASRKHLIGMLALIVSCLIMPRLSCAETEVVDGIEWIYHIENDSAIIGTNCVVAGVAHGSPAIPTSTVGTVITPRSLGGKPVRGMVSHAFSRCQIKDVIISEGVEYLGDAAFYECGALENASLPTTLSSVGESAFAYSGVRSIVLPKGLRTLGRGAFAGCMALINAELDCNITVIPQFAFSGCDNLQSVSLPHGLVEIGDRAFCTTSNTRIEEMRFPATLQYIARTAFAYSVKQSMGQGFLGFWYKSGYPKEVLFLGDCPSVLQIADSQDSSSYGGTHNIFHERTSPIYITEGRKGWGVYSGNYPLGVKACVGAVDVQIEPCNIQSHDLCRTVSLSCINEEAVLYYTLDGSEPTTHQTLSCQRYNGEFEVNSNVEVKALAYVPSYPYTIVGSSVITFSPETPVIETVSETFSMVSLSVTLSCETDGATIYYTVDGSEPSAANGRVYKGPFDIFQTTTVKAIAVKDDWKDSAVASATFAKENAIGPAINLLEVLPDNDKTHPWEVVTDVTHDGVSAVKSGSIEDEESTTLKAVIYGAGRLSFWWRTSCEPAIDGEYYDFATFFNGTTEVARLAGATDWQQVTLDVAGTGKHTFKWTYQKDDSGTTVPDGVWLDQVQWLPQTDDYYSTHTLTTETPVPYLWLDKYGLGRQTDSEAAAKAKSGKVDGAGRELTIEEEYIAGTDPTNATSQLKAFVDLSEGYPKVTWEPDLNEDGTKAIRTYKVWGKEALEDGATWAWPTNSLHRFFKVTVEMP